MTFTKQLFSILFFSLSIIPVWGLSFLDSEYANQLTIGYGLILTVVLFQFLKAKYNFKNWSYFLIASVGPFIYLFAFLIIQYPMGFVDIISSPILLGFSLVLLNLFLDFKKRILYFGYLGIILIYSLLIYPNYRKAVELNHIQFSELIKKKTQIDSLDLSEFPGLEKEILTKYIAGLHEFILIETWNEKCKPCISSMSDLQDYMKTKENVLHIFLYQKMGNKNLSDDKVRIFKAIDQPNSIVIDVDNDFYNRMQLSRYPYFILFDGQGKQLDWFSGYLPYFQNQYQKYSDRMLDGTI